MLMFWQKFAIILSWKLFSIYSNDSCLLCVLSDISCQHKVHRPDLRIMWVKNVTADTQLSSAGAEIVWNVLTLHFAKLNVNSLPAKHNRMLLNINVNLLNIFSESQASVSSNPDQTFLAVDTSTRTEDFFSTKFWKLQPFNLQDILV